MKFAAGLLIAFFLGAVCRWLDLPVPSPPRIAGVMLILAITLGYLAVDRFVAKGDTGSDGNGPRDDGASSVAHPSS